MFFNKKKTLINLKKKIKFFLHEKNNFILFLNFHNHFFYNYIKGIFVVRGTLFAKYEALAKENASSYINPNNKRVLSQNGFNSDGTPETMLSTRYLLVFHLAFSCREV
jgi:hypothetical protein